MSSITRNRDSDDGSQNNQENTRQITQETNEVVEKSVNHEEEEARIEKKKQEIRLKIMTCVKYLTDNEHAGKDKMLLSTGLEIILDACKDESKELKIYSLDTIVNVLIHADK